MFSLLENDITVVYLSNRTNYDALAEIGCDTSSENEDQTFLRTTLYSNSLDGKANKNDWDNNPINSNHVMLACTEKGWTYFKENTVLSTKMDYTFQTQDVSHRELECVTNTCGSPNVVMPYYR